jgi:RNA polymerase sigma-70 factor (ECF subfamily)
MPHNLGTGLTPIERSAVTSVGSEGTDEALMVRFQSGERSAFAVLVRRYQTPLYNFALRQLRSPPGAEEVVQDAFVRVVQGAADFKHAARFSTWLYTIARNLCVDHIRKRALRQHPSLDAPGGGARDSTAPTLADETADRTANVERTVVAGEIRQRVLSAVEMLPDDQREVFLLREVSNLPFREIAEIVGAPENTVKSRMRYALERLQEALSEFEEYARALR